MLAFQFCSYYRLVWPVKKNLTRPRGGNNILSSCSKWTMRHCYGYVFFSDRAKLASYLGK